MHSTHTHVHPCSRIFPIHTRYATYEALFLKQSGVFELCRELSWGRVPKAWRCKPTGRVQDAASLLFASLALLVFHVGVRAGRDGAGGSGGGKGNEAGGDGSDDSGSDSDSDSDGGDKAPKKSPEQARTEAIEEAAARAHLNPLQLHVLDLLRQDLETYATAATDNATASENRAMLAMAVLAAVADPPHHPTAADVVHPSYISAVATASIASNNTWLPLLLRLAIGEAPRAASCRVRQLAVRVCGRLLPVMAPAAVPAPSGSGADLVATLLHSIGQLQVASVGTKPSKGSNKPWDSDTTWLCGRARMLLAGELVDLVRILLQRPAWRSTVTAAAAAALSDVASHWAARAGPDPGSNDDVQRSVFASLGALAMLCQTATQQLAIGARVTVETPAGRDDGHVVALGGSASSGAANGLRAVCSTPSIPLVARAFAH